MKDGTYQYYAGNMVYKNDKSLNYLSFEEGLVIKISGGYAYEYHLKDHLGLNPGFGFSRAPSYTQYLIVFNH